MSDENQNKSWIGSVFESITAGFNNTLSSIKKHGWKAALFTLVGISLLWSVVLNPIRIGDIVNDTWQIKMQNERIIEQNKTEESIIRRENANYFVSDLMINIMNQYKNVNRVILLEKHNGSSNIKGIDFLYSSATYELVNEDTENPQYLYDDLQKQTNINLLGVNFIQTLKHKDYLYFNDLKKQGSNNIRLLRKLRGVGDNETIIYSFKDSKHTPIILLIISGDNLDVDSIINYIKQFQRQIEELLID